MLISSFKLDPETAAVVKAWISSDKLCREIAREQLKLYAQELDKRLTEEIKRIT